jgi:hypothetical protein
MRDYYIATIILAVSLTSCARGGKLESGGLVLPNPKLIGCRSAGCQQLWKDDYPGAKGLYPKQLSIDFKGSSPFGITAKYDKSTPSETIKAALDKDYGKWAAPDLHSPPTMVWRVEPEQFVIQLGRDDDGMQQLIYLSLKPELR